jgi:transcriptional regulator with XRE-family HTH domain
MDASQQLKNIILSKYLSIRHFSEKSGLSYDLISNAIHGKTKSPKVLAKIAKALYINPEVLIDSKDLKTVINAVVEIEANDQYYLELQTLIIQRFDYFKVQYNELLLKKIAHAVYYYNNQITKVDENTIVKIVDGIILYGIMESKIKEK